MKLKTKLKITFLILVFCPVLLMILLGIGYGNIRVRTMQEQYGVPLTMNFLVNSLQTISESTEDICSEIREQAQIDPEKCLDSAYLESINEQLEQKKSYLLVLEGEAIYYQGVMMDQSKLVSELVKDQESDLSSDQSTHGYYISTVGQHMIRRIDVKLPEQEELHLYIVTSAEYLMKSVKRFLIQMSMAIIGILLVTALGLVFWIHRSMTAPIGKLSEATKRIAAGDLDFSLETKGNDEISCLFQDFEKMRCNLKESEEQKREFDRQSRELIRNISHDLKTPITTIKGYVEGIMDGVADTPEKMDRYIRTIYNKAIDMDRLVNELTFYSQIDTNRIPYNYTRLKASEYFGDCAEELCMDLEEKGITFVYENKTEKDTRIIGDPEQLKRVIDNITGNSVKYMDKKKGRIELRILDVGDFVQVEIEDNGKGIAAEDLPHIFSRFYRTDEARSFESGGSGIGLSIVKKIIEDHGGSIWTTSKPGKGTTMYFVLRKYLDPITTENSDDTVRQAGRQQKTKRR